jgi:ankyrin repeat protein
MPTKTLPGRASLEQLKNQAKDLMRARRAGDLAALQRTREFHPRFERAADAQITAAEFKLSDAQLTVAREYGFPSWPRLKARIERPTTSDDTALPAQERIKDPVFRKAVDLLDAGDAPGLRAYLQNHPGLVSQRVTLDGGNYFQNPSLLEFSAENPIRRGKLPQNVVEIAKIVLDAGARSDQTSLDSTLGLVSSGRVARESNLQIPLIDILCDYGAEPNAAMQPALAHGEFAAVEALLRRGATVTLPLAAATAHLADATHLLPSATPEERHRALALAAQFGHTEVVRLLLDAAEYPNRYNPVGCHSHSTPLHQAAWNGHLAIVKLLVERGARLDIKDIIFQGTPLDWAKHNRQASVAEYLQASIGKS